MSADLTNGGPYWHEVLVSQYRCSKCGTEIHRQSLLRSSHETECW